MSTSDKEENNDYYSNREIHNSKLFSEYINFSDTEQILFQEDLDHEKDITNAEITDKNADTRYTPVKKIRDGGMKTIWEVKDTRTQRTLAMALIQPERIASKDDIESFLYEARLTAHLQHPNIIPIYDVAIDKNGNPYFTMKLLKGETLESILNKIKKNDKTTIETFSLTRLLNIFISICDAIDYAHTKGVLHLDIKPSNVMVGDFGEVHILDWGIATLLTDNNKYLNDNKVIGGTPGYMSPEQAMGHHEDLHFHTDIYMLCALLYQILTLQPPHTGKNTETIVQNSSKGFITPPHENTKSRPIPKALSAISMKGLSIHPDERYSNISSLKKDIRSYLNGYATLAENPNLITHIRLLMSRHKIAFSILGLTLIIVSFILILSFYSIKKSEQIALNALDDLQKQNTYIEQTAFKVAPDYLELAYQHESKYNYELADKALETALTFDVANPDIRLFYSYFLLSNFKFQEAYDILTERDGLDTTQDLPAIRLAKKWKDKIINIERDLAILTRDFIDHNLTTLLPRFYYQLNQKPFDSEQRMLSLKRCLEIVNPEVRNLNLKYNALGTSNFIINLGNNKELNNLTPLSGLNISVLNLNGSGRPNILPIRIDTLRELRLANTRLETLDEIGNLPELNVLDISNTKIRNLSDILIYPKLTELNVSGIENLELSPRLIWCQKLKKIIISPNIKDQDILKSLITRGVIINYDNQEK